MRPIALAVAAMVALPATAGAATTDVKPGHRAIQRAIHRAQPGDTLRIAGGNYGGSIVVDKRRLRIVGVHGRPKINGGCSSDEAVNVAASGVVLRHLKIVGGREYTVNYAFIAHGRAINLRTYRTCTHAEYGINVYRSGDLRLYDNSVSGYRDSGIYVGGINNTRGDRLLVRGNHLFHNNRGLIVEDTTNGPKVDVRVRLNNLSSNRLSGVSTPSGLFLHNSDRIWISDNTASNNSSYGFHADSNSDSNRFFSNSAMGNGIAAFLDEGMMNCGSGNSFPIPPC